jgi:phosphoribosyl-ATP pyrophosphohydrolase/phosphoribosyl-AMP cyclohydrolase
LARVRPRGPACHTGEETCFGTLEQPPAGPQGEAQITGPPTDSPNAERTLPDLWGILQKRARFRPEGSYTVRLLDDENLRLKKLGEETAELILALARDDQPRMASEAADLVYHLLVALMASGVGLDELLVELETRKA